jgi:hypothetical protein
VFDQTADWSIIDAGTFDYAAEAWGYPEEGDRARALEAGAVDFLSKPFDGKTMIRSLSAALKGHNADANE